MTNPIVCPYCKKTTCQLEAARRARSLTLESVGELSPEQLQLASKLETVLYEASTSRPSWRDMVAPYEPALALEAPMDTSSLIVEEGIECANGMFAPPIDHWFTLQQEESRLSNGLVRPDAMPDEQVQQLRELMLSRPAPKQSPRHLTQEQLRQLGWLSEQETAHAVSWDRVTVGGLLSPE